MFDTASSDPSPPGTRATNHLRLFFIEMMGEKGSYDASVYDHFEDKDDEGQWFVKRFGGFPGIHIKSRNVCRGEPLPAPSEVDGLVLAGSYNSVHDHTNWQRDVRKWLPVMRKAEVPILGICGSHQLLAHMSGGNVIGVEGAPYAGTFPIELTEAGQSSPLMAGLVSGDCFQYANSEHVRNVPRGSQLLATGDRIPVAALDYGNHCYTTQFHPEGTHETLGTVWRKSRPELMQNYHDRQQGNRLVENFLGIVSRL